jgi:hypothetical protein
MPEFKHDIEKYSSQLQGESENRSLRTAKPFESMMSQSERSHLNPLKLNIKKNPYLGKSPSSNFQKNLKKPPIPAGGINALNSNLVNRCIKQG